MTIEASRSTTSGFSSVLPWAAECSPASIQTCSRAFARAVLMAASALSRSGPVTVAINLLMLGFKATGP
jgi:hypothetical protein